MQSQCQYSDRRTLHPVKIRWKAELNPTVRAEQSRSFALHSTHQQTQPRRVLHANSQRIRTNTRSGMLHSPKIQAGSPSNLYTLTCNHPDVT